MSKIEYLENSNTKGYYILPKSHFRFEFSIDSWNDRCKDIGSVIRSKELHLADGKNTKFLFEVYPGGLKDSNNESIHLEDEPKDTDSWISVILINNSLIEKSASIKITIVQNNQLDGTSDLSIEYPGTKLFTTNDPGNKWIIPKMVSNNYLTSHANEYYSNDILIFIIDISILGEAEYISKTAIPHPVNINYLQYDISKLYNNSLYSDIILIASTNMNPSDTIVENISLIEGDVPIPMETSKIFYCHKSILAIRSETFELKFKSWKHQFMTLIQRSYHVKNMKPIVLQEMLYFIYTDSVHSQVLDVYASEILIAAIKYKVLGLVILCEDHIAESLSCSNWAIGKN